MKKRSRKFSVYYSKDQISCIVHDHELKKLKINTKDHLSIVKFFVTNGFYSDEIYFYDKSLKWIYRRLIKNFHLSVNVKNNIRKAFYENLLNEDFKKIKDFDAQRENKRLMEIRDHQSRPYVKYLTWLIPV